jgi:hypothetical protein
MEVTPAASLPDQARAAAMIDAYGLNRPKLVNARLAARRHFLRAQPMPSDPEWNYQDFLDAGG